MFALALALGASGLIVASTAVTTAASAVLGHSRDRGAVILAGVHFSYPTVTGAGLLLLALATLERSPSPWPSARAGDDAGHTSVDRRLRPSSGPRRG